MDSIIAKMGDRFDSIFARHYGNLTQQDYENGYNAFVLANIHLIDIPVFSGGEIVYLPIFDEVDSNDLVLGVWE